MLSAVGVPILRPVFVVLSVLLAVGSIGVTVWWLTRRRAAGSRVSMVARCSVAAGTLGGLAMIPPGLLLKAAGYSVNVYGELLLRVVLGRVLPGAMVVQHLAVSVSMAVPFVAFAAGRPGRHLLPLGAAYGTLAWLLVNSCALPIAFGRPTPWALGFDAIWPSLLGHVVYGLALGTVVAWDDRRPEHRRPGPSRMRPRRIVGSASRLVRRRMGRRTVHLAG
jgi:uncharacterized membrane protein YagU involved in acid resistance